MRLQFSVYLLRVNFAYEWNDAFIELYADSSNCQIDIVSMCRYKFVHFSKIYIYDIYVQCSYRHILHIVVEHRNIVIH